MGKSRLRSGISCPTRFNETLKVFKTFRVLMNGWRFLMANYIIRRLLYMLVVILVVSVITFLLMHAVPGGPFTQEKALPEETIRLLNERYHLNDPLYVQYFSYLYAVFI